MKSTTKLTAKQAMKIARKEFIEEHGKRAYNALVTVMNGNNGRYVLINASGLSTEFYF